MGLLEEAAAILYLRPLHQRAVGVAIMMEMALQEAPAGGLVQILEQKPAGRELQIKVTQEGIVCLGLLAAAGALVEWALTPQLLPTGATVAQAYRPASRGHLLVGLAAAVEAVNLSPEALEEPQRMAAALDQTPDQGQVEPSTQAGAAAGALNKAHHGRVDRVAPVLSFSNMRIPSPFPTLAVVLHIPHPLQVALLLRHSPLAQAMCLGVKNMNGASNAAA